MEPTNREYLKNPIPQVFGVLPINCGCDQQRQFWQVLMSLYDGTIERTTSRMLEQSNMAVHCDQATF